MQNSHAPLSLNVFANIALVLKEGLRGARHIMLSARTFWVNIFKASPAAVRQPSLKLVDRFDNIADRVDRRTSQAVHLYLDPAIARDSETATFSKIIQRDDAPVLFAKLTYDNLKLLVVHLSKSLEIEENFFISEMLSACAYRKSVGGFYTLGDDEARAGLLAARLTGLGVVRTRKSANAVNSANDDVATMARVACFAHMLWLVVAKDFIPEREEDLLLACGDLALVIEGQIEEAGNDPQRLGDLLKTHAEIV